MPISSCPHKEAGLILVSAGVSMLIVRRAVISVMIWLVLATCLVCPVMQMFDNWDHELQTGQDTESAFMVLALCIGATIVLTQAVLYISKGLPARAIKAAWSLFRSPLEVLSGVGATVFLSASPPPSILRI